MRAIAASILATLAVSSSGVFISVGGGVSVGVEESIISDSGSSGGTGDSVSEITGEEGEGSLRSSEGDDVSEETSVVVVGGGAGILKSTNLASKF